MKKTALFIFILFLGSVLWAQNRHALVIGNANYPRVDDRLPNAINDTNDLRTALLGLGFNVELKQDLQRLDMIREINAFLARLRGNPNSEGFFWYAGHAIVIEGENYLMPLDVTVEDDEIIKATSYPLNDLIKQLGEARNKINVVVLDACRTPPGAPVAYERLMSESAMDMPAMVMQSDRSMIGASRVIRRVQLTAPDLFVIYSTEPGTEAFDGTGRNSPFAEAFLMNIRRTEPLRDIVVYVTSDTLSRTGNRQRPYISQTLRTENINYSLSPQGSGPVPIPDPVPEGLEYSFADDGVIIAGYTGNASALTIPAQIQGLPVTGIRRSAFSNCRNLTSVIIPSSVTTIENWAFSGCTSLTSVNIPSSVRSIGYGVFYNCTGLTSITVDNRNSAYSSVDGVLFDKSIRTIIEYPAGKTARTYAVPSSVTYIGYYAFSGRSNLTSVTIPSSVTSIRDSAFSGCTSLAYIVIPSSVTAIGNYAFSNCTSLANITIPSSVTAIGDYSFIVCTSLTSITVDSRNPSYASSDGVLFDKNIRTLIKYPEGKTARAYAIPSSVTSIGYYAFHNCNNLTSITIPSSVTSIGEWAFSHCNNLTSITVPSSVTDIGNSAFYACTRLTGITVDSRNPVYASSDGVLFDKNIRTLVMYPEGKIVRTYTIPSSVTAIGDGAFYNCNNLTGVTIPSSVTSIENWAFSNCDNLTSIFIPSSITSIGDYAFYSSGLTSITIPSSVRSIGDYAFSYCGNLTSVSLSRSTRFRFDAFPSSAGITFSD